MADIQAEIACVCRLLDSDKVTERKQNVTKLKNLLNENEIVQLLDVNSDKSKQNVICWDYIFKSVQAHVNREIGCLKSQKPRNPLTVSSTAASNRDKKRQEVTSLLKFVIKTADARERCRLNGKDVVQHITTILKNQDMNGIFVSDYQNILLKYILSSKVYRCEITLNMWHDLIDIFSKMLTSNIGERSFTAKIFSYLVTAASNQVDVISNRLFKFFTLIFTDVRNETNSQVLEYLLCSLNSFCTSVAVDCRGQLCQLGEELIPNLLQIWNKPNLAIKERLVQFMRLQVRVHHPSGVHSEKDGAWSANTTHWKKCLQKVYESISGEIQQLSSRIRGQSVKLDSGLKQPLIELAADICNQLFWFHSNSSPMPLDSSTFDGPSTSKRRRVEVGWNVVRNVLSNGQETPALLGWLQIIAKLLEKFPSCLPQQEYVPLLSQLHQLQMECKRPEVVASVMICLKFVARSHVHLSEHSVEGVSSSSTWKNIWLAALRAISSHDLEDASFELLESIVKKTLTEPDTEPWKLLSDAGCSSSQSSLRFLWCYLNTLPLPENFYYSTQMFATPPSRIYPLRQQLFDWLLPPVGKVEQQGSHASNYYSKILTRLPVDLLSCVLVILTQRTCQNNSRLLDAFNFERKVKDKFEEDLGIMENIYIVSSFDKKPVIELIDPEGCSKNTSVNFENNTVEVLLDYLVQRLLEISQKILNASDKEFDLSISSPQRSLLSADKKTEMLTRYCCLSTRVLGLLLHFNAFSFQELIKSSLYQTTKSILKAVADNMTGSSCLKGALAALNDLFLCQSVLPSVDHENTCVQSIMDVVRSATPKRLLDCLFQIISNEPRQFNKSHITVPDEFDGPCVDSDVAMDDFETDYRIQTSVTDQRIFQVTDKDNFSEQDQSRLRSMEILCTWCACSASGNFNGVSIDKVQTMVFDYFECADFDIMKTLHLKLFSTAAFILGSCLIKASHLLSILQILRASVSKFRKDQEYCKEGLRLMTVLAKQFTVESDDDDDMKDAQALALHLVKAFWNLRETNYRSSVRLQLAKCMDAFIRFDKERKWALFEMKNNNNVDSPIHISHLFPRLLCDPSHHVRMYMAEAVGILFLKFNSMSTGVPETPVVQDELFDIVADALAKSLVVEHELTDRESEDEGVNRAASLLSAFRSIITVSCWCEPKIVCLIFQATKEQELDQEVVAKVLHQISLTAGYQSAQQFIKGHIGRVIDNWLNYGFELKDFPFRSLEFESVADFLRAYHASIMPHLIWRYKEKASLKTIGREIGNDGDWTEFLVRDFCQIMAIIVPRFAEQSRQKRDNVELGGSDEHNELERDKQRAYECHEFLESVLQKEVTDRLMVKRFDELIVELLLRMHDTPSELSDVSQFLREYDPPTDKPYFTSHAIKATLDYLTKCHGGSNTLVSILCRRKENIQKILLRLCEYLEETHVFHKRRSFLGMYRVFVLLLLQDLSNGLAGTWAFVVRDVVYTLIRIISKQNAKNIVTVDGIVRDGQINIVLDCDLFTATCDLLYQVCKVALSCCPQEIGNHLLPIVNEIIPFVSNKGCGAKKAVALLKFLLVDNKSCLQSFISLLDPFPDQPEFAVFNDAYWSVRQLKDDSNLSAEIEHYLSISSRCPHISRLEGLRHLCSRFVCYKKELQEATTTGSNDSTLGALLMKLLRRLIKLCKNSTSEMKVEVGKLFAEIGLPVLYVSSFNTISSEEDENYSYSRACEIFRGDEEKCRNCRILHALNHCLTDRCIKKVAAAASCLKGVLQKQSIITLMKLYEELKIDHLFGYLEPFKPSKRPKKSEPNDSQKTSKGHSLEDVLRNSDIWNPGNFDSHDEWISSLTSAIISSGGIIDEVLQCLAPLCRVHASFADSIFPYLIHDLLLSHGDIYRLPLSEQIRKIFSSHILSCSNQSRASTPLVTAIENSNSAIHDSIHSVLNVVNYLRKQRRPTLTTAWESNFWLDLDFLELAEASVKSSAYCTAILYVEVWSDIQRTQSGSVDLLSSHIGEIPMEISSESTDENRETNYQSILFEAYASIGEPDAVYGSASALSTDLKARIHTYEQEKCWGKALRAYDLYCRQSDNQPCVGMIQTLKTFGLEHVTFKYLKGLDDDNRQEFLELQYESAWRNRIWNIDQDRDKFTVSSIQSGFNQCVYDNIQSLKNRDSKLFRSSIDQCRLQIVEDLCRTNTESLWEVFPHISRLQCLSELEQAKNLYEGSGNQEILLNNWIMNAPDSFNELEFFEPILSLRTVLLQELLQQSLNGETCTEMKNSLLKGLVKHSEMVASFARHAGGYQISERALLTLKDLQKVEEMSLTTTYSWKMEEAKVFWFQGEHETAMRLLRQINDAIRNDSSIPKLLHAQTLGLYGSWLAETRSENPNTIMKRYLDKAVELAESCNDKEESSIEAFLSLARFADSQYKNTQDYMKSWAFERKQCILNKSKSEIANLKEHGVDKGRYLRDLSLQSQLDEEELTQRKEDRLNYLHKAVRNYIRCLQVGGKYDLKVFRICSLWMANSNDDSVNRIVEQGIFSEKGELLIESRKFLPLMYQLAARLGAKTHQNELFQRILSKLISQAAIDHPHHVIWIVLALCNADKDNKYLNRGKKSGRLSRASNNSQVDSYVDEERVQAARNVIETVRKSQSDVVSSMERLSEAYIELAYFDVSLNKNQTGPLSLPDLALKRISGLRNVALPTSDIKVDPTCRYKEIIFVEKFDPKYQLCGGINLPKILNCVGSDGIKRRQLIKGKDDLRQDAVMQQVFGMVNLLLQKNIETRKRNLKIRTYKVVPLSQRSGLVEWCEETTPLGNYLIGGSHGKGAHQRYYPKDWSSIECRKRLQVINRTNGDQRYKVFKEISSHFHPVFRHFFMEQFPDPSIWFEKRLGYTRSVATASIVGYIVGLGDRHVQNILIDCNTAELIHIDLGVAFEQGKMLPTPETVPFRLTRDLVDGMGISGVEGVFRRCCEKTMEVMRTSQEALLTIVEVLLYDPLYVWTLSPIKAMSLQRKADMDTSDVTPSNTDMLDNGNVAEGGESADENSVNKMAERVLVRLRQKLDGIEDGTSLSVKGQVNHLIREARDPKNLCRLFPGWQPWI